jgi:hypothetical protein
MPELAYTNLFSIFLLIFPPPYRLLLLHSRTCFLLSLGSLPHFSLMSSINSLAPHSHPIHTSPSPHPHPHPSTPIHLTSPSPINRASNLRAAFSSTDHPAAANPCWRTPLQVPCQRVSTVSFLLLLLLLARPLICFVSKHCRQCEKRALSPTPAFKFTNMQMIHLARRARHSVHSRRGAGDRVGHERRERGQNTRAVRRGAGTTYTSSIFGDFPIDLRLRIDTIFLSNVKLCRIAAVNICWIYV